LSHHFFPGILLGLERLLEMEEKIFQQAKIESLYLQKFTASTPILTAQKNLSLLFKKKRELLQAETSCKKNLFYTQYVADEIEQIEKDLQKTENYFYKTRCSKRQL
jgi:hypothetical protein